MFSKEENINQQGVKELAWTCCNKEPFDRINLVISWPSRGCLLPQAPQNIISYVMCSNADRIDLPHGDCALTSNIWAAEIRPDTDMSLTTAVSARWCEHSMSCVCSVVHQAPEHPGPLPPTHSSVCFSWDTEPPEPHCAATGL